MLVGFAPRYRQPEGSLALKDVPAVVTGDLAKFLRAWPSSLSGGLPVTLIHRISYVISELPLRNPKSEFDSRRARHADSHSDLANHSIAKRAGRPKHEPEGLSGLFGVKT